MFNMALKYLVSDNIFGAAAILVFLLIAWRLTYNLFFHPLRHYPGPFLYRASRLPYIITQLQGKLPFKVLEWSDKYGPVIRLAPDELAYTHPDAWQHIYGHHTGAKVGGHEEFPKSPHTYRTKGIQVSIAGDTKDRHRKLRRQLAPIFSERAIRDQEVIIDKYVTLLIKRLHEHCQTKGSDDAYEKSEAVSNRLDLRAWYNWTTFDIIGDMSYGESFGCLEKAAYDPWVADITETVRSGPEMQAFKLLGLEDLLMLGYRWQWLFSARTEHEKRVQEKLNRRIAMGTKRKDFLAPLIENKHDWDRGTIRSNAAVLTIAGSETTATTLCGVTFLLLNSPECFKKLTEEVRTSFDSEEEITMTSVGKLTYMIACLNESLRRYPPVPTGMPRVVPQGGATIIDQFVPEGMTVSVWQWAMYHSTQNFKNPFKFNPDRLLGNAESNSEDKIETLQPFSIGPRNCIGRNLAFGEMKFILARILWNFDMELASGSESWMEQQKAYFLWLKPELPVYLKPRSQERRS
ncbi:cytochrome p450 monooxygenase [Astrocystis sublimbata]|nr:cytochrome p450 monooxygenase [Astrocystis sublimbata]